MQNQDKNTNSGNYGQNSLIMTTPFPYVYNNIKYSKSTTTIYTNHVTLIISPGHNKANLDVDNYYEEDAKLVSKIMNNSLKSKSFKNITTEIDLEIKPSYDKDLFRNSNDKNINKQKEKEPFNKQKK